MQVNCNAVFTCKPIIGPISGLICSKGPSVSRFALANERKSKTERLLVLKDKSIGNWLFGSLISVS